MEDHLEKSKLIIFKINKNLKSIGKMSNVKVIKGSEPFQINAHSFIAGPSSTEYTFSYSADGINYTPYTEKTPAGETLNVFGVAFGSYCKLDGATGEIIIRY